MMKGLSSVIHEVIHFSSCLYIVCSPICWLSLKFNQLEFSKFSASVKREEKFVLPKLMYILYIYKLIYK